MSDDLSEVVDKLTRLLPQQLVVRAVLCWHDYFPGCRIELMSCLKELKGEKTSAFVHVKSDFYWHNDARQLVDSFEFETKFYPIIARPDVHPPFYHNVRDVVDYWQRNVTPDTETPQEEWLREKPFVGVVTSRKGSSSPQRFSMGQDARPFLGYYGLLRSQLSARAKAAAGMAGWNSDMGRQAEIAKHVEHRFETLFTQAMKNQVDRAIDAI